MTVRTWFEHYFAPSHFDDLPPLIATTRIILLILCVTAIFLLVDDIVAGPANNIGIYLFLVGSAVSALASTFLGYFLLPRLCIPFIVLVLITYIIFSNDMGLHDYAMQSYPAVIILAGLLLGKRAPLLFTALSIIIITWLCHAEITGLMPSKMQAYADYADLLSIIIILAVTGVIMQVLMNTLTASAEHARNNETQLREANHQLRHRAQQLEMQELALRESTERYHALFNRSVVGIYVHDLSGQFLDANDTALEWFGYTREQIGSLNISDFLDDEQRQAAWASVEGLLQAAYKSSTNQYRISYRDGRIIWLEIEGCLLYKNDKPYAVHGLAHNITERQHAEELIRAALQEKEVLLKEIHHRVKNNMQVVSSLLNLQAPLLPDEESRMMFRESQQRIKTMSLIHERLYQSENLTRIDFSEYVSHLVHDLYGSYSGRDSQLDFRFDIAAVQLELDVAIPCGLIVNELVSNAIKYAFPKGAGAVFILLRHNPEHSYELTIQDDGIGVPKDLDIEKLDSLGLQLVKGLAEEQLDGTLELDQNAHGTKWIIRFPVAPPLEKVSSCPKKQGDMDIGTEIEPGGTGERS